MVNSEPPLSQRSTANGTSPRAAVYVDKILKGSKASDIPIEQVSKFELVIDLRVAHEQGIRIPQELLLRADEVIR